MDQPVSTESRRLVTAREIDDILPIEGADAIELAVVGGWKVVIKKGDFKIGDPAIYFEIDSFLPDGVPAWQFLIDKQPKTFNGVKGHKLRTIKLRGQISQGLVLPLHSLPLVQAVCRGDQMPEGLTEAQQEAYKNLYFGMHEYEAALDPRDMEFSALLGVVKWEATLPASLAGQAEGLFPSFIQKTDQERCQNLKEEIFGYDPVIIPANEALGRPEITRYPRASRDTMYEVTMKLDGSSMTAFVKADENGENDEGYRIGVCSRNLELKINDANEGNTFVRVLLDSGLNLALAVYCDELKTEIAVQGEVMGPGIQGNREELQKPTFFLYDVYNITEQRYMTKVERDEAFRYLKVIARHIEHVPVIAHAAKLGDTLGITNMDELLKFAEGPSIKHPVREGLVFKRLDGQFSFKVINNRFLLTD